MVKRHNIRANSKSAPRPQALSALDGRGYERPASSKPKILSERGARVELRSRKFREVKAKAYDPHNEYYFIGKRGAIVIAWKP